MRTARTGYHYKTRICIIHLISQWLSRVRDPKHILRILRHRPNNSQIINLSFTKEWQLFQLRVRNELPFYFRGGARLNRLMLSDDRLRQTGPTIIFAIGHQLYILRVGKRGEEDACRAAKKIERNGCERHRARPANIRAGSRGSDRSLLRPFNRSFSGGVHFNTRPTQIHCVELAVSIRQLRDRGCQPTLRAIILGGRSAGE